MLAGSQIEILGDTEKYLTERVVEGTRAVHPSESRASRRPGRAIAGGAEHVVFVSEVGLTPFPCRDMAALAPMAMAERATARARVWSMYAWNRCTRLFSVITVSTYK